MCNRYSISKRELRLSNRFGAVQLEITPRYNIAPTQLAPVAFLKNDALACEELAWGFPGFNGQPVMNARSETVAAKRLFRDSWKSRPCVVASDGFYEWKQTPEGKQPYRCVRTDRALYWFAGLWEDKHFTILTAPARGCIRNIHDRMPIILADEAIEWWLTATEGRTAEDVVARCAACDLFELYPVTPLMSNSRHASADCIEPFRIAQQELELGMGGV